MALKLKRTLSLFEATFYGVGIIVGAGIYALLGEATNVAGNAVWISFLIGAAISAFTGLSYAELSAMYPKAAAEYVYIKKAYASKFLAFMIGWLIIFTGVVSVATVALGFSGYFASIVKNFYPMSIPDNTFTISAATILIIALSYISFLGIKESSRVNIVTTGIEIAGLVIIILLGLGSYGSVNYFEMPHGFSGVLVASTLVFFAYIGFEDIANISEETKNPKKVLPRALMFAIVITAILYLLTSISAISLVNWQELGKSTNPLALVASKKLGSGAYFLLSFIALFATSSTVLIILIVVARMMYGMADHHALPHKLASIHHKRRTPWIASLVVMSLSIIFVLGGKIETVASITSLGAFITFITVNLSLIWLRFTHPKIPRPFKVPLNIGRFPILPFLGSIFSVFMIFQFEWNIVIVGIAILIVGAAVYYLRKNKIIPIKEINE